MRYAGWILLALCCSAGAQEDEHAKRVLEAITAVGSCHMMCLNEFKDDMQSIRSGYARSLALLPSDGSDEETLAAIQTQHCHVVQDAFRVAWACQRYCLGLSSIYSQVFDIDNALFELSGRYLDRYLIAANPEVYVSGLWPLTAQAYLDAPVAAEDFHPACDAYWGNEEASSSDVLSLTPMMPDKTPLR